MFKKVIGYNRTRFLPSVTPKYLELENVIYQFAQKMIVGYSGAYLSFFKSETAWYVMDSSNEQVTLKHIEGEFSETVSAENAWLVVTSFAMNYHLNKYYQVMGDSKAQALSDAYYVIRDMIIDRGLYRFID